MEEHRLKFQRSYHVAYFIPDHLVIPKTHFAGEPTPVRDFSRGSIYRMEAPNRIFYDPHRQDRMPHMTQYYSSQFKFPLYPKPRVGRSWLS